MNIALLAKWWRRFALEENSLWKRIICARYKGASNEWDLSNFSEINQSGFFTHIINLSKDPNFADLFGAKDLSWNLGKGSRIFFWEDIWWGEVSFKFLFPRSYLLANSKKSIIADLWNGSNWELNLRKDPRGWELQEWGCLNAILNVTILSTEEDKLTWIADSKDFSVHKMYSLLAAQENTEPTWTKALWIPGIPSKISAFCWLACLEAIPSKCFLDSRGMDFTFQQLLCPQCSWDFEDGAHLILHCRKAWEAWLLIIACGD